MTKSQPQQEYIEIIEKLGGVLKTANIENTPEWMDYVFGEVIPEAERKLEAICSRPLVAHTSSTEAPICDRCKTDQEPFCIGCERLIPHDTAIRNATLDEVKQYADTCIWIDDDCCPGKMNEGDGSDCDGCSYVDYPNNADICEKIESLRKQGEP